MSEFEKEATKYLHEAENEWQQCETDVDQTVWARKYGQGLLSTLSKTLANLKRNTNDR